MAVQKVIKMGHSLLLQPAKKVDDFDSPDLKQLLIDMKDTMHDLNGAGLAAPQIAVSLRVVIFGITANSRYPEVEPVPETILINPTITVINTEQESDWEGCLSVPHMRGLVPRYKLIKYQGFNQFGDLIDREVSGFHARVVQHEVDHLDGILYPQRIEDMKNFGFEEELFYDKNMKNHD